MSANTVIDTSDSLFEEQVINGDGIIVVDFWAPWCGPCHSMAPALESFASSNEGAVKVFKLDVDDNPKTAERFEIRSIPTVIFFQKGEAVDITPGALSEATLQEKLDRIARSA
jgi:thioredoxin 1